MKTKPPIESFHLAKDKRSDQQASLFPWERNVRDQYKSWTTEQIKEDLKKSALPFAVLMSHIEGDFNFGNVVRSANNFGASRIFYYGGKRHWDRRSAVGSYLYSAVEYLSNIEQVIELKKEFPVFVGMENNIVGTRPIKDFEWQPNSLLLFGEENSGLPKELLELVDHRVEIPSAGSIRSLNVGTAAGIAMYDYWVKSDVVCRK